jgi:hypothetical protein
MPGQAKDHVTFSKQLNTGLLDLHWAKMWFFGQYDGVLHKPATNMGWGVFHFWPIRVYFQMLSFLVCIRSLNNDKQAWW